MKTVVFVDELLLVNFAAAAALLLGAGLVLLGLCVGLLLANLLLSGAHIKMYAALLLGVLLFLRARERKQAE